VVITQNKRVVKKNTQEMVKRGYLLRVIFREVIIIIIIIIITFFLREVFLKFPFDFLFLF
jgi:hypothetical protein